MSAKLSEFSPDCRSFRSSDSGDSSRCRARATYSNNGVMVVRTGISHASRAS
jgi:hypothetical protein